MKDMLMVCTKSLSMLGELLPSLSSGALSALRNLDNYSTILLIEYNFTNEDITCHFVSCELDSMQDA